MIKITYTVNNVSFPDYVSAAQYATDINVSLDQIVKNYEVITSVTKYSVTVGDSSTEFPDLVSAQQYAVDNNLSADDVVQETESISEIPGEALKIYNLDLVYKDYKNLDPAKIDFTMHLQPGIFLQKSVQMGKNGRPVKATYTYNGELMAEILFTFETNGLNLMTRRTEQVGYYDVTGVVPAYYLSSDRTFNLADLYQLTYVIDERFEARQNIFNEIKAVLNGFLYQAYSGSMSYQEILNLGGTLWADYSSAISSWINTGGHDIITKLQNETNYPFLDLELQPGVTVRAYIIDRITY